MEASAFGINKGSSCDTVAVKMLKGVVWGSWEEGVVQLGGGSSGWDGDARARRETFRASVPATTLQKGTGNQIQASA